LDDTITRPESNLSRHLLCAGGGFAVIALWGANERVLGLLANSLQLAVLTLSLSLPPGVLLALAMTKTNLHGRRLLIAICVALLFVPLVVQAAAWQAAWGYGGWLRDWLPAGWEFGGWTAAVWVHGAAAVPWVAVFTSIALANVPRELEEDASLVLPAWQVLWRVSLPAAWPGIAAAALWVAVLTTVEIAVTDLFQVRTFAEEVYTAASMGTLSGNFADATSDLPQLDGAELWAGTTLVMCLALAALAMMWRHIDRFRTDSLGGGWKWQTVGGRMPASVAGWLLLGVLIGIPTVSLVGQAGTFVEKQQGQPVRSWSAAKATALIAASPWRQRRELRWSLAIGGVATAAATTLAALAAWLIRTRPALTGPCAILVAFGFAAPGPLVGVGLIGLLNQPADSPLAWLAWCYDNTVLAPVVVQTLRVLPLATLLLGVQFASLSQEVLDSAASEGAGWCRRLLFVALPMRWQAVAATACLGLVVAAGELSATLLVAPPGVSTLSMHIFSLLHYGAEDQVAAISLTWGIGLGLLTTAAGWLAARSILPGAEV
jgi:iron(III) transport system permease protein